jgi:hypothetical protein
MRLRFVVYLLLGCLASTLQFAFFDCNGVQMLSFVAGALTIVTAFVVIDRVYCASVSTRSPAARIALGVGIGIVGAGAVFALGLFTMITHMCG